MDPRLYKAAMEGNAGEILVQKQQELDHQMTPNNNTILHVAALFGNSKCVEDIITWCPSLLCRVNIKCETALHIAAKEGHTQVVSVLIECAKGIEEEIEYGEHLLAKEMLRMKDKDGDTALHKAVRNHHCTLAKLLIEEDPEFAIPTNKAGETPAYLATEGGSETCLSSILNSCASPAYVGPCGRTALHAAVIFNLQGCMKILLDWKKTLCEEADVYGWTPLHYAALFGHIKGVEQILDVNKPVAYLTTEKEQATALHIAASQGHRDIIKVLVSHCPDCWEMVNVRGQNILHIAVVSEKHNVIRFILNSSMLSSLIGERDIDGNTPLHLLAAPGCFMPGLIYHPRVNQMAFNNENKTPLDVAYSDKYISEWGIIRRALRKMGGRFGLRDVIRDEDAISAEVKACDEDQKAIQEMRQEADTSLIVAALIATVTFAAGFTLPGGYDSNEGPDQGMAILTRKAAFKAFVVTDTIALMCSSCAVFVYFIKADYVNKHKLIRHYTCAKSLVTIAMGALVLAFITGLYAVLAHSSGLAAIVCVIGICSFLVYYYELRPAFRSIRGRPRYLYFSAQTKKRGRPTYMLWGDKTPPRKFVK